MTMMKKMRMMKMRTKRTMRKMRMKNLSCFSCSSALLVSHSLLSFLLLTAQFVESGAAHGSPMETDFSICHLVDSCFVIGWQLVISTGQEFHGRESDELTDWRGDGSLEEGRDVWSFSLVACFLRVRHFPLTSPYLHL